MRDFNLFDIYTRNRSINGNSTALVTGETRLTFNDLYQHSIHLAGWLVDRGVKHGDRVALLSLNHPGFFILFGALARIGAILVPLNWRLSEGELGYILNDSATSLLFADGHQLNTARTLAEPMNIPVVKLDQTLNTDSPSSLINYTSVDASAACIIYTAAVEGNPKGAVLSHSNLIAANLQVITSMGLSQADVNLAMLPLFHITGMNLALAVLQMGGSNVLLEKFDEQQTIDLTNRERVTLWGSFPPILQRMTETITTNGITVPSLRYVVGIDGPNNILAFEEATQATFWILYGQSETSGFVTLSPASEKPGTAGKQGPLSTFMLVDEHDQEVPQGATGEIAVRGPLVFQGYWRQDETNRHTFRNGWHHTGDLGLIDDEGYLVYQGRKPEKELIKPGGENVYPAEVETVIMQHPEVTAVSVIGVPDPKFGEGVKAVCVLRQGSSLTAKELIDFVGSRIARYKKPGYVEFVETLPTDGNRIDRQKVKALYGA